MSSAFRSITASFGCERGRLQSTCRSWARASSVVGQSAAVLVERADEIVRDVVCRTAFDLPALEHEHDLAVLHERNLRRRRRIAGEIAARSLGGVGVLAGENRGEMVGLRRVL